MSAPALPTANGHRPEDRRLKALGLVMLAGAGAVMAWLTEQTLGLRPLTLERALPLGLGALLVLNLCAVGGLVLGAGLGATRTWRPSGRRRAMWLVLLLANVMLPVLWFALIVNDPETEEAMALGGWELVLGASAYAVAYLALRLWRRSRKHVAEAADTALARDPRPPVLYLRSFRDDGDSNIGQVTSAWGRWMLRHVLLISVEEELAAVLQGVGPVVAIGKPGEPLPELGAARLYVAHEAWQGEVAALMRRAGLVVVRVGASPGVLWEIEQALAHVPRSRLVLAILGGQAVSHEIVDRLGSALGAPWTAILPQALPEVRRRTWLALFWSDPRRRLGSLVCFDASGRAHAVPIRLWPLRWRDAIASIGRPAAGPLRYAWREVFRILAMESGGDNRLLSRGMAVMLALSFGWSGAHWFYLGHHRRAWIYLFSVPLALLPLFLAWYDALRFIWIDRATFESLAAPDRLSSGTKEIR